MTISLNYSRCKVLSYSNKYFCCKYKLFDFIKCRNISNETSKSKINVQFSTGNNLLLSTGKYARFADGCAVGQIGNTSVMVAVVSKEKFSPVNFAPITVDYRQKAAAAGRIPTNFLRRELGPNEKEILTSRLIDRSLRPLFPAEFSYDTHITCNLLAVDGVNDPDVVSINAASAALLFSDIPWNGPVGAVRVGLVKDQLIVNPTRRDLTCSTLNLIVVAANQQLLIMLEGSCNCISQPDFCKAIKFGVKECQNIIQALLQLKIQSKPKRALKVSSPPDENVVNFIKLLAESRLREIFSDSGYNKVSRDNAIKELQNEILEKVKSGIDSTPNIENYCASIFHNIVKNIFRTLIFEKNERCDGRKLDELRNVSCEINLYDPLHGSALFQRGQTQVLCTVALDSLESAVKFDPVTVLTSGLKEKNFFLHYEFPQYAVNELSTNKTGLVRRDIGHGALAERSLRPAVPSNFPFTIRLTSEVLESNGSSSMATVCGGSLALMDAGVPLSSSVAGVAIGLVTKYEDDDTKHISDYRLLTDILGIEDYMGDMDLKLAGTKKGITAIQADIKIPGLPLKIVMEAVNAACEAKTKILNIMDKVMPKARNQKKSNWPVSEKLEMELHKRSKFIGPGGINLKKLMVDTGVQVTLNDDGSFTIFAPNQDAMDEAKEHIMKIMNTNREPELEFGAVYKAKIIEIKEIGVMVSLHESMMPALLHNSQLDHRKISHPSALGLKVGDEIQVKYFGRDPISGVVRLSRKVLLSPATGKVQTLR